MKKKYICVYCGSNTGDNPIYASDARALAREMVQKNMHLVYGAGNVGLMGIIADEILSMGGEVIGVIPQHLVDLEVAHHQLTELIVTQTMHERKAIMAEKSDAFVAMPGGIGTLEEVIEIMTWTQLGLHQKPVAFYNINAYYDQLFDFFRHMEDEKFLKGHTIDQLICEQDPAKLLKDILEYTAYHTPKWM